MTINGSHHSYRAVIAAPGVAALLVAILLARLAGRMLSLAIVLYALGRFASPALAGWLSFALVAPGLVVSPVAGALLDRIGAGWAVALDMAASAAVLLALVGCDLLGWASPGSLFALVALFSLTSPLGTAGVRTLLPQLVPPATLDRANALDTAIYAAVDVVGPALAGLLVALAGPEAALTVIAGAFAAAALCIARLRHPPMPRPRGGSLLAQAWEGLCLVLRQPTLRGLAVSYALYQASWGILMVVVPVFALRHFSAQSSDLATGLLWTCAGLAGGVGALLAGRLRTTGRERAVMAGGMLLTALAVWPVAALCGLGGLVAGLMLAGFVAGPIDVGLLTLRQRRTDPRQFGRVFAVSISLNIAGFPLGAALGGVLIGQSLTVAFVVAGLVSLLGALATLAIPREPAPAGQ
jgi:predicted MFS family arabinose efflux permease